MNRKSNKSEKLHKLPAFICTILVLCIIFSVGCCFKTNVLQEISAGSSISQTSAVDSVSTETTGVKDNRESSSTDAEAAENELRNNFEKLKIDEKDPAKILIFLEKNISIAGQPLADEIIYFNFNASEGALEKFTDNYANSEIQNAIYDEFDGSTDLEELRTSQNRKLALLAQKTIDRKYKLFNVEGFIMPLVDYKAYSVYRENLSKEMNDYMDIMQAESDMPSAVDAGITISLEDFVGRIIAAYKFVENYPASIMSEQIKNIRNGKIWIYFAGIDNTPVFDHKNIILPERLKNFQETEKKFEGTEFGKLLKEYLDLLDNENYSRSQKVSDYLEKLSNS